MTKFSATHPLPSQLVQKSALVVSASQFLRPLGLSLLIASGVFCAAQAQTPVKTRSADFIVAVVNSEPITNNEVQALRLRIQNELPRGTQLPDGQTLAKQALDQLIIEKAQLQVARENGIRVEDSEIELTVQNIARQNQLTKEQLFQRLRQDGLTVSAFREQLRTQLMINKLREREVENKARISDTDVEKEIQTRQLNNPSGTVAMD